MYIHKVIHNTVRKLLCTLRAPVMNKVILTPKKAVNEEKMLKNGFFAITASLCGFLMGPAGCSLLPDEDETVSLIPDNVLIRKPAPLTLPLENVVHSNNKYHQDAYLIFTETRSKYINKLKSLDAQIKEIEKISEKELRAIDDYPLLKEHIASISIFEEPTRRAERRKRKIEEIDVKVSELKTEIDDLSQKRSDHPKFEELYTGLIKTKSLAVSVQIITKKRWSLLFDFEVFLKGWYLSKLTVNQPSGIQERYPRIIEAQFVARLGINGQAITDTNATNWGSALYYAIRANARYPEDDDFNAQAYEVDPAKSTVTLKPEAYEDEPFTGQVIFMMPSSQIGWAVIDRGLMIRSATEPAPIPILETSGQNAGLLVEGRLYQTYEQGQVTRSSLFEVDLAGKTLRGSLLDSEGRNLESRDYRSKDERRLTGVYEGNQQTLIDGFNRTKLNLSENGNARKWTYVVDDRTKVEKETKGSWTLIDGQIHLHLPLNPESISKFMPSDKVILEMDSDNQLAVIAEIRPDGRRTEIFAEPDKRFVYSNPLWGNQDAASSSGVPALPEGTILSSQSEVRVDPTGKGFFTYKRTDDAKLNELQSQIEAATDPAQRDKLQADLDDLKLAGAFPYNGKIVEFWDEKRTQKKREENFQIGRHNGSVTWWHPNGQKQFEGEYLKGIPQGATKTYNEAGIQLSEKIWENDKLSRATTWDANNQKTGDVTAGNGTLVYFHPNAQKQREEIWENGTLKELKFWDETGNELESAGSNFFPVVPKQN